MQGDIFEKDEFSNVVSVDIGEEQSIAAEGMECECNFICVPHPVRPECSHYRHQITQKFIFVGTLFLVVGLGVCPEDVGH